MGPTIVLDTELVFNYYCINRRKGRHAVDNPDPSFMPVASKVCNQCLLSSFPLVDELRRHQILKDCRETGRTFLCHKATMNGEYVVCRGFYNKDLSLAVTLAKALDRVKFVEVPE